MSEGHLEIVLAGLHICPNWLVEMFLYVWFKLGQLDLFALYLVFKEEFFELDDWEHSPKWLKLSLNKVR